MGAALGYISVRFSRPFLLRTVLRLLEILAELMLARNSSYPSRLLLVTRSSRMCLPGKCAILKFGSDGCFVYCCYGAASRSLTSLPLGSCLGFLVNRSPAVLSRMLFRLPCSLVELPARCCTSMTTIFVYLAPPTLLPPLHPFSFDRRKGDSVPPPLGYRGI